MKKVSLAEMIGDGAAENGTTAVTGVVIGRLVGIGPGGEPIVDYCENPAGQPRPALSTAALDATHVGHEVALMFVGGDADRPLLIGPLLRPDVVSVDAAAPEAAGERVATVDGDRVVFNAEQEIVLRCGAASITLTRAGKILIRGKYVLSRSSGVNRIKGGSIQLN